MQRPSIKAYPLSCINGFSWNENNIMHLLLKNEKKTYFWMKFHPINKNFQMVLNFNTIHHKKNHSKNLATTLLLNLSIYTNFKIMWLVLFCQKYIPHVQNFQCLLDLKKELISLNIKLIKYTSKN
jgi:hypothetical protein